MKGDWDIGRGFGPVGPLRSRGSSVHVAFRPVEPLVAERIAKVLSGYRERTGEPDEYLSIAIRSVDGFFVNASGTDPSKGDPILVRVIDYDATKEIFLVSGDRDPDPYAAFFWFCFRAFPQDGVACAVGSSIDPDLPAGSDGRVDLLVRSTAQWKDENPVSAGGRTLFRCPKLEGLRAFLWKGPGEMKPDQDRSQGS